MNILTALRAYTMLEDDMKKAKEEVNMEGLTKAGWKTSEFWLTILAQVPTLLGMFLGASNPITLGVGAAAIVAYTLGRSWSKANALAILQGAATAATALPAPQPGAIDPATVAPANGTALTK